jgi:hypothetical protein
VLLVFNARWLIGYRVVVGMLGFAAVVTEIATLVERDRFKPANFFSFFTIEANSISVIVLILSAITVAAGERGRLISLLRGANTLNMIVVGVVFSLLLAGLENTEFTAVPWDNTVLHYVIPVAVALDWLADRPQVSIGFKQALVWVVFPIAYLVYSLIRGPIVDWYPYPFLDADEHGYASVLSTSLGLLVMASALAWVLARVTGRGAVDGDS